MRYQLSFLLLFPLIFSSALWAVDDGGHGGGAGGLRIVAPTDIDDMREGEATPVIECKATGGTTPYAWSATGLPDGVTLVATPGSDVARISGRPDVGTGGRDFTIELTVQDAVFAEDSQSYEIHVSVDGGVSITSPTEIDNMRAGVAIQTIECEASGGTEPYTWSVEGLPPGLVLTSTASGTSIRGTPEEAAAGQDYTIVLTVEDDNSDTDSETFEISVAEGGGGGGSDFEITVPTSLPNMREGLDIGSVGFIAVGGTEPYSWSATGLPDGIIFANAANGRITGTPGPGTGGTDGQDYVVVVTVEDDDGETAERTYDLHVLPGLEFVITEPTVINDMVEGSEIPVIQCEAIQGKHPYYWEASGLPPGVTLLNTGAITAEISGTPDPGSADQSYTVELRVEDNEGAFDEKTYEIYVYDSLVFTSPESLDTGAQGVEYSYFLEAKGGNVEGTDEYVFRSSNLPDWLSLDEDTGEIYGTPEVVQWYLFDVSVEDRALPPNTFTQNFRLYVDVDTSNVRILTEVLPTATVGSEYNVALAATWGEEGYRWTVEGLPSGLSASHTGVIQGIPLEGSEGSSVIDVTVIDSQPIPTEAIARLNLFVTEAGGEEALSMTTGFFPPGIEGEVYGGATLEATGGEAPYTWSAVGLPAGVELVGNQISGTIRPAMAGLHRVNITLQDQRGEMVGAMLTFVVAPNFLDDGGENPGDRFSEFSDVALEAAAAGCKLDAKQKDAAVLLLLFMLAGVISTGALLRRHKKASQPFDDTV